LLQDLRLVTNKVNQHLREESNNATRAKKEMFNLKQMCPVDSLRDYAARLYPICRSITGNGFLSSLNILEEIMPMERHQFDTGEDVLDWTIPNEWNIRDAYIITPDGNKIANFKESNLHIVGYSEPVDKDVSFEDLLEHLHTLPSMPDAVPYVTSYYRRNWGFCISQKQLDSLKPGTYHVTIDSDLEPGKLTIAECVLPGETDSEILLSSYLCHPSMGNHELGGSISLIFLYKILKATGPHRNTFRFLICPENIGSAAFLSLYGEHLKNKLVGGYVVNCVGHGEEFTYKKSRQGNSQTDLAAQNVLQRRSRPYFEVDFYPDGSDERQFCSPGYNFPIGLVMRTMYGKFPEYHTSLDDLAFLNVEILQESILTYFEILKSLDINFRPLGRVQHGTPQLSKSQIPLYRDSMNFRIQEKEERTRVLLEILNCADGEQTLLEIAQQKNFLLLDYSDLVQDLLDCNYLSIAEGDSE